FPPPPRKQSPRLLRNPVYEHRAKVLREARERAGLSVLELARKTRLLPTIIEDLEDPTRLKCPLPTLEEIAKALGCELHVEIRLIPKIAFATQADERHSVPAIRVVKDLH